MVSLSCLGSASLLVLHVCAFELELVNLMFRWKLLEFAQLERTSVSFFEVEKPETAVSRWSRASTRAAKVGSESLRHVILRFILLVINSFPFSCFTGGERLVKG